MIVVLEGPDGAGKTTLARQLCEQYGWVYHHEGPPPADKPALDHYSAIIESHHQMIVNKEIKGVVFDRLALGERVYGPIYRKRDKLGEPGWRLIKQQLESIGAIHVLCLPGIEVCLANWRGRAGEMFKDEDTLWLVWERYFDFVPEFSFVYDYNYPQPVLTQLHDRIGAGT